MVDIVLIKPGSQKQLYGELSAFGLTAIEPPLWLALLGGYLRSLGYSVVLYDAEAEGWTAEEAANKILATNPTLTAVVVSGTNPSASTMNMTGGGAIITALKQQAPEARVLLAGLHPSALPERTLREEDADFVCQGEGFYTLPDLVEALKGNGRAKSFSIKGLWYRTGGTVVSNPRPPLFRDFARLPRPAWDLLPMDRYRAHNWHCFDDLARRQPYGVIYTSLGCPFRCSFCCINALFGKNTIRYRPLQNILAELDYLVTSHGIRNLKIIDEMFALQEKRVIALCQAIKERGYDLNIWAYARVDTVTPRMLAVMKEAGINWLAYGFESGSRRVIRDVAKGYRPEMVEQVVRATYAHGINICANYIFGLPEDDSQSMRETLEMMLDINAEWANIYCAMAYPGSELFETAQENGWPLPTAWQNFSQYSYETLPLPTRYLSGGQVLAFRDHAFQVYYNSPHYLDKITRKFGMETAKHIQSMAARKLPRRYAIS